MSWLRNHVQSFVIPGIRTLVRAGDRELLAANIKPFDGVVRPSTNCKHEEAGLVYATIASMVPKAQKGREALLAMCRTLDGTSLTGARTGELGARFAVPPGDVVHSIIWNSFRKLRKLIRREGAVLVLPGRDVWAWEVIARQRRLSSVYDSRVSRTVAGAHPALRKVIDGWKVPDLDKSLVFDTGFAGSIHREICAATQKKPLSLMLSAHDNKEQIFPGHTGSRGKALAIEYFPKYFQRATVRDNDAYQALSGLEEFIKTALLTIWLWHHVSPAHIDSAKPPRPKTKPTTVPYVGIGSGGGAVYLQNDWSTITNPMYISGATTGLTFGGGFYNTSSATIPSINIVSNGSGQLSYQIPIVGQESTALMQQVIATGDGPGGLLNKKTAQELVEQTSDLKQLWGDGVLKDVVQTHIDAHQMKKQMAAPNLAASDNVFVPTGKNYIDLDTLQLKQAGYIVKQGLPVVTDHNGYPLSG